MKIDIKKFIELFLLGNIFSKKILQKAFNLSENGAERKITSLKKLGIIEALYSIKDIYRIKSTLCTELLKILYANSGIGIYNSTYKVFRKHSRDFTDYTNRLESIERILIKEYLYFTKNLLLFNGSDYKVLSYFGITQDSIYHNENNKCVVTNISDKARVSHNYEFVYDFKNKKSYIAIIDTNTNYNIIQNIYKTYYEVGGWDGIKEVLIVTDLSKEEYLRKFALEKINTIYKAHIIGRKDYFANKYEKKRLNINFHVIEIPKVYKIDFWQKSKSNIPLVLEEINLL